jgi:hypothetical protein
MNDFFLSIVLTAILGGILRLLMLRSDYRQYPTYPHGYISHLSLGFIAASLGAVALPALLSEEFVAVTFLALAAQQFRDIRNIERETLSRLDKSELVPRGEHFIEGIARAFEARNFLIMGSTLILSAVDIWLLRKFDLVFRIPGLVVLLLILFFFLRTVMEGKRLGHLAKISVGKVHFEGPNVFVDDIHFMNLGLEEAKETYLDKALGLIFDPKGIDAAATLANVGQRQAIVHICSKLLGIYKDVDTREFTPLVRRDVKTGRLGLLIIPATRDMEALLGAVEKVPILEGSISRPSKSVAGRERDDYEREHK